MTIKERYARQVLLPEIGTEGQLRLAKSRVLIVGAGGLGCPIALYLAAGGVGCIGLIDGDRVGVSNLHRQVLYEEKDVGNYKVECAAARLKSINQETDVQTYPFNITAENAQTIITDYDIVVDACDNYATRYLVSDECKRQGKPYVYGAIQEFCGQVTVFLGRQGDKTYRDLFPDEQKLSSLRQEYKGVVGMVPAVVGSVQAHEVMKLICGYGESLVGRLWTIDLLTMQSFVVEF